MRHDIPSRQAGITIRFGKVGLWAVWLAALGLVFTAGCSVWAQGPQSQEEKAKRSFPKKIIGEKSLEDDDMGSFPKKVIGEKFLGDKDKDSFPNKTTREKSLEDEDKGSFPNKITGEKSSGDKDKGSVSGKTTSEKSIPSVKSEYRLALPGYTFKFPSDHFSHDDYRTEWWYYTGHLQSTSGKEFGFELTFFRSGVPLADGVKHGPWVLKNIYMTHLALSDVAGKTFYHDEKICRAGVGSAGAEANTYKVWTENWSVNRDNGQHHLVAKDKDFGIDLQLDEGKSPAIHGENGVSQKASCVGCASHYYSFTRMPASGKVSVRGETIPVKGIAWMDHEFGSNQLTADQVGWDWYSIQLDDNTELMLYVMRLKNGKYDTNSSGTYILADGKTEHLPLKDYKVSSTGTWVSPHTGGKYPSRWHVSVPSKRIELNIEPLLDDQELLSRRGGISYWEGTCKVSGSKDAKSVSGKAYVELTGYSRELNKNI